MNIPSPRRAPPSNIAISVTVGLDGFVSSRAMAAALMRLAWERCGRPDDASCDWYTDAAGNTYITPDPNWQVSKEPEVAALVDAAHVLLGYDLQRYSVAPGDFARAAQGSAP